MDLRTIAAAASLLALTCPLRARGDAAPYDERTERPVEVRVELTGLAQFPGHVFYLYPSRCTDALGALDVEGPDYVLARPELRAAADDYRELQEGPLGAWLAGENVCQDSRIYALARGVAAGIDLAAMDPVARQRFFAEDPRLFRPDLDLPASTLAAPKFAKLRSIQEVLRVRRITRAGLSIVIDAATYRFVDDVTQTLRLAHTRRLPLPFGPLSQERLDKFAAAFAAWEARQPAQPPPAPELPAPREAPEDAAKAGDVSPDDAAAPELQPDAAPELQPDAAPELQPDAKPGPEPVAPDPRLGDSIDLSQETVDRRAPAWPLAALLGLVALVAGLALARRRR